MGGYARRITANCRDFFFLEYFYEPSLLLESDMFLK